MVIRRSCMVTLLSVLLVTFAAARQETGLALLDAVFGSAGGPSLSGSISVQGLLGSSFEGVVITNGDVSLTPGISFVGPPSEPAVVGDLDGDGSTAFPDFLLFAAVFGTRTGEDGFRTDADFDQSGDIGFPDFLVFAVAFGQ